MPSIQNMRQLQTRNICVNKQHTSLENELKMKCASLKVDKPTKTDFKTDFLSVTPAAIQLG